MPLGIVSSDLPRCSSTFIRTSATANMPSVSTRNSTPSNKLMLPKVNRWVPLNRSTPTVESSSPAVIEMKPLMGDFPVTVMTSNSPNTIRQANSGGPNATANFAMIGAHTGVSAVKKISEAP